MGGNAIINGVPSHQIDLKMSHISRTLLTTDIKTCLFKLSNLFYSIHGIHLWNDSIYFSGSSTHLFNAAIPDDEFIFYKPVVGDIDVQLDLKLKDMIKVFFIFMVPNHRVDNMIYIGHKCSSNQIITIWKHIPTKINIQIDFELVDFDNNKPTEWSQFSHSSSWDDLSMGIKGVFQKYIFRSLQHRKAKDILILPKTSKGKEKIIHSGELAFSLKGIRYKIEPVLDEQGNHLIKNGMYVYKELDSKDSEYITDLELIFQMTFNKDPSKDDITKMASFVGVIDLIVKNFNELEQKKVLDAFANLLWEKGAQGLVRGDPRADYDTKIVAFNYLINKLDIDINEYYPLINKYYGDIYVR